MTSKAAPTGRELQILKILWEHGPSTVKEVHRRQVAADAEDQDLAYNTVQTLLRLMEENKGLVTHEVRKRTFVYSWNYSRDESTAHFLERVFDGAASEMVLSLLRTERVSPEELEELHRMIAAARAKQQGAKESRGGK